MANIFYNKYRITVVLKVETGRAVILVIMYVEIFHTGVIVFIGEVKICLRSHCPIIFNIRISSLACELRTDLIFKVSLVIQTLSAAHIKGKMSNLSLNLLPVTLDWTGTESLDRPILNMWLVVIFLCFNSDC